jgi:hypothetical protein
MRTYIYLLFLLFFLFSGNFNEVKAQKPETNTELQEALAELVKDFKGTPCNKQGSRNKCRFSFSYCQCCKSTYSYHRV